MGGADPMVNVRMSPQFRARIEAWGKRQQEPISLSEAIREMCAIVLEDE